MNEAKMDVLFAPGFHCWKTLDEVKALEGGGHWRLVTSPSAAPESKDGKARCATLPVQRSAQGAGARCASPVAD